MTDSIRSVTDEDAEVTINTARDMLSAGYSVEYVVTKAGISLKSARKIQEEESDEAKDTASDERIILRRDARHKLKVATEFMESIIAGEHDLDPVNVVKSKLDAAKALISYGSKFISEDAFTNWTEQTDSASTDDKPLSFEIKIDDTGKTTHEVSYSDHN